MSEDLDFPAGWCKSKIKDIFSVEYGKSLVKEFRNDSGEYPVIGSSGIVGYHDSYLVEGPSVVVGRKGSVGSVTLLNKSSWPIDTVYFIQPPLDINIKFIYYQFLILKLEELDRSTTIPGLSRDDFYTLDFLLCSTDEQNRIVEKLEELLSDLDNGVAELKAAQTKLTQYRQSLLKSAVEGTLTQEWREANAHKITETGEQLLARILKERRARWEQQKLEEFASKNQTPPKDWQKKYPEPVKPNTSDLPELPEGWVWTSLDMLGDIVSGVTKGMRRNSNVNLFETSYLRVANVQRGYLDLSEIKTIPATQSDIKKYTLKKGDILFNEGGDRDKLGRGWVWYGEVENCIHQNHVFRMRPFIPEIVPEIISHYGNTFGKLWFQNAGKQTTNLASINKGILQSFPVPLSPYIEQLQIMDLLTLEVDNVDRQIVAVDIGLKESEAQRKNILKNAFSGRLVEQSPDDEPASLLLERIKTERVLRAKKTRIQKPKKKAGEKGNFMKTLLEVLQSKEDWIDAQDAFNDCGVGKNTSTDNIESLYLELRSLIKDKIVEIKRVGVRDEIKLIKADSNEIA